MTFPISLEFFPPKTPEGTDKLRVARRQLYALAHGPLARLFTGGLSLEISRLLRPLQPGKVPLNVVYLNCLTDPEKHAFLAALATDDERSAFVADLHRRVEVAYESRIDGKVLFPFRRTFVIAYR